MQMLACWSNKWRKNDTTNLLLQVFLVELTHKLPFSPEIWHKLWSFKDPSLPQLISVDLHFSEALHKPWSHKLTLTKCCRSLEPSCLYPSHTLRSVVACYMASRCFDPEQVVTNLDTLRMRVLLRSSFMHHFSLKQSVAALSSLRVNSLMHLPTHSMGISPLLLRLQGSCLSRKNGTLFLELLGQRL